MRAFPLKAGGVEVSRATISIVETLHVTSQGSSLVELESTSTTVAGSNPGAVVTSSSRLPSLTVPSTDKNYNVGTTAKGSTCSREPIQKMTASLTRTELIKPLISLTITMKGWEEEVAGGVEVTMIID